ncbi:hypothetical protein DFP72DRAFT_863716 [Ephemerocybe angulata]|uniref:Uncharacterized protein n=1 Tax=Ephemerocybe angulata TaxID=980116 RepID=A0A8H6H7H8_9AGAR|nr:hypothetical protein DFP72DRAFT_863716 [Tulosesus angulatus]
MCSDTRFQSQIPAIFTQRMAVVETHREAHRSTEATRLHGETQVKKTITTTCWFAEDTEPIVCAFQNYVPPNFTLDIDVLTDNGLSPEATHVFVLEWLGRRWLRVRVGHVVTVNPDNANILLKAVAVTTCPKLDKTIAACLKPVGTPHFRLGFQQDRASVKQRDQKDLADRYAVSRASSSVAGPSRAVLDIEHDDDCNFLDTTPSTKRKRRDSSPHPYIHASPLPMLDRRLWGLSPSPPPSMPAAGRDAEPIDVDLFTLLPPSRPPVKIKYPAEGRLFPGGFRYSEVVAIFAKCSQLSRGVTVAARFKQLTGLDFVPIKINYYDCKKRWDVSSQSHKDAGEADSTILWKDWAKETPHPSAEHCRVCQAKIRRDKEEERKEKERKEKEMREKRKKWDAAKLAQHEARASTRSNSFFPGVQKAGSYDSSEDEDEGMKAGPSSRA